MTEPRTKDRWDKWDVILKPVGGLLTALAVAGLGLAGKDYLERRQNQLADERLYTQLMSSREQADSNLRKEMLTNIIDKFLGEEEVDTPLEKRVLGLELLAYNFHDSLDLGPLFKHVGFQVDTLQRKEASGQPIEAGEAKRGWPAEALKTRLTRVAADVSSKQLASLHDVGEVLTATVRFDEIDKNPSGVELLSETLVLSGSDPGAGRRFTLWASGYSTERKEIQVLLEVWSVGAEREEVWVEFWVGFFDFPMIDNTRLLRGDRISVVLTKWTEESAEINLAYFPGSRASLKEKPYYDELLDQLRQIRSVEAER